jgi:CheY-like chemotaxis protein
MGGEKNNPSATVLVVDDDAGVLRSLERALGRRGLTVITTDSPLGVSGMVRKHHPDVLVLDMNMPALNGQRLAELVAAGAGSAPIPIVFYSGVTEEELYAASRAVRHSTYVSKDAGTEALYAAIVRMLKFDSARSGLFKVDL